MDPVGGPDAAAQQEVDALVEQAAASILLTHIMNMIAENKKMLEEQ